MQRMMLLKRAALLVRPLSRRACFSTDTSHVTVAWRGPPKILSASMKSPDTRLGNFEIMSRMGAADANPAGNVHGGIVMQMMEQAGQMAAARHCSAHNPTGGQGMQVALVRLGHVDFWKPAYQNDVISVQSKLVFTSPHSMLVLLHAWAEDMHGRNRRLTNRAFAWYVPVKDGEEGELGEVPPMVPKDDLEKELFEFGEVGYRRLKKENRKDVFFSYPDPVIKEKVDKLLGEDIPPCPALPTVLPAKATGENAQGIDDSKTSLSCLVLPSDCLHGSNVATRGMVFKIMDEAAALCAMKHCHAVAVTAAVDALDVISPVRVGNIVQAEARIVFAGAKSMEIEVRSTVEDIFARTKQLCNIANFTYVAISKEGKSLTVPPIKIQNESEWLQYHEAKQRYEVIKAMREAASAKNTKSVEM